MEPNSGIEKLIGFIYRILFTIIPSGAFLCVSVVFLIVYSKPQTITDLIALVSGINPFWLVLLPLCLIFSLSLFIESLDLFLFYYMMDFQNLSDLWLFGEKSDRRLYDLMNKDFNELYKKTDSDSSIKRFVERAHFALGLIKSVMYHPRVYSQIYYQLGREYVFNNLTVVVLLICNCFAPYVIAKYDPVNFNRFYWLYQALQPVLTVFYLIFSYAFLKEYNAYKHGDKVEILEGNVIQIMRRYFVSCYKMPYILFTLIILLIVISSLILPFAVSDHHSPLLFFAFNCLLFPIVLAMVFKGFNEYLDVEKYYLAYFVEKHFSKSDKERQVSEADKEIQGKEWNFRRTSDYDDTNFAKHVAPQILGVYEDGMGRKGWSIDGLVKAKKAATLLGLLEDADKGVFGYCFVSIPDNEFHGKKILWIDSCSISMKLQSGGYYKQAIRTLIGLYDRNSFGYLGGRTQNPVIMYSHDEYCEGEFLPFDNLYPDDLMQFLIANIREVREPEEKGKLDKKGGLCKKAYTGILGKYPLAFSRGRCPQFEEKLKESGFNRDDGDAVIILKELN